MFWSTKCFYSFPGFSQKNQWRATQSLMNSIVVCTFRCMRNALFNTTYHISFRPLVLLVLYHRYWWNVLLCSLRSAADFLNNVHMSHFRWYDQNNTFVLFTYKFRCSHSKSLDSSQKHLYVWTTKLFKLGNFFLAIIFIPENLILLTILRFCRKNLNHFFYTQKVP